MSESQNNARAHQSMIPPPATKIGALNGLKRDVPKPGWFLFPGPRWGWWQQLLTASSTAELSEPKRGKTLAERAGEYPTKALTAPASGIARAGSVRGQTLAQVGPLSPLHSAVHPERQPESLEMAPESNTASSIVSRPEIIRIVLWIVVHLCHTAHHILHRAVRIPPLSPILDRLLVAFSPR